MVVKRGEFWLVNLDPVIGREIKKTRPCMILSPDESNVYLDTIIAAPLTSTIRNYPSRVPCLLKNKKGQIAIDQLRCLDKSRLVKKIGNAGNDMAAKVFRVLNEYFHY